MSATSSHEHPAVELRGAAKRYGSLEAVARLSLCVRGGETVALLGPSGSGKTTLLSMMAGELQPTDGSVQLHGRDLAQMRPGRELSRQVGMVHQQFDLVPNLSALHNALAGKLGQWSFAQSLVSLVWPQEREAATAALARVGVAGRASLRASRLSGGEQQRVAIARLLVQDPAIFLADEPVASLDPTRAEEVMKLLVQVAHEAHKTLVASVHSVDLARRLFRRIIGLRNGTLAFDLPAERVDNAMLENLYTLQGLRGESIYS